MTKKPLSEYDEVKAILKKHNWLNKNSEDMIDLDTPLYEELYSYFCNSGEMPYDVCKARADVMPDEWIADRLFELELVYDEDKANDYNAECVQDTSDMVEQN
jgi:hypothetical protein